jgi:dihydroflavonol-4-reductase
MRAFVTGATGFIGSHLVPRLLRDGHELRCLVRRPGAGRPLEEQGAATVQGDVTDPASLREAMAGCDWVLHLANVYSFWEPDPAIYARVNIEGTRNVLGCARAAGVTKVVHVSSAVVYGRPADVPFREESPVGPVRFTEYARTKYAGDRIAWDLQEKSGLPLVTILPGSVLGPGDSKPTGQYIQSLIRRRMPARVMEETVLTFVHVRDVAEAIVRAAEREGNLGERYLVGSERLSFGEINRMVSEISHVPLPALRMPGGLAAASARLLTWMADRTGQPPPWGMSVDQIRMMKEGFQFDGSKAERELGIAYTPVRTAIEEMIASCRT